MLERRKERNSRSVLLANAKLTARQERNEYSLNIEVAVNIVRIFL